MRRAQYQREVLSRLARIDSNLDKISKELARQAECRERAQADRPEAGPYNGQDKESQWIQNGIENIMSYQAGKKREGEQ